MNCPYCQYPLQDDEQFCPHCGEKIDRERENCPNCGAKISPFETICHQCGYHIPKEEIKDTLPKSRRVAIILGVLCGSIGVHNFYLGYTSKGFIQLVLFFLGFFTIGITSTIALIWGLMDVVHLFNGKIDRDGDDYLLR